MFVWSRLSAERWTDAWEERFAGHCGAVITRIPGRRTVRVEVYCAKRSEADAIARQFGGTVRAVRARNWAAVRPELPPPVRVRDALIVSAESARQPLAELARAHPGREIISIPPDMAFGTGHHETTSTVLRLLVDFARARAGRPWSAIDLGTGTGLLAIAAARLGARDIRGCDFDPHAVRVARQNLRRNRVSGVVIEEADALRWKPGPRADCVMANLFSDVLIAAFPRIVRLVRADGVVFLSGILKSQAEECLRAGKRAGLRFDKVLTRGRWVTAQGCLR